MAIIRPYSVFDYIGFFVNFEHKHQSPSNNVGFFYDIEFNTCAGWAVKSCCISCKGQLILKYPFGIFKKPLERGQMKK